VRPGPVLGRRRLDPRALGRQADPQGHPRSRRRAARGAHRRGCDRRVEPRRAAARRRAVLHRGAAAHRRCGGRRHRDPHGRRHPRRPGRGARARARREGHVHRPALPLRAGGARRARRVRVPLDHPQRTRSHDGLLRHHRRQSDRSRDSLEGSLTDMLASAYDGVIFDCDGVLVDSEPITNRLLATMVGELGVPISVETAHRMFVGRSFADDVVEIENLIGRPVPAGWEAQYIERRDAALAAEIRAVSGVDAVLSRLVYRKVPVAVASGAERAKMRLTLGATRLDRHFDGRVYGAAQVTHAKPAPDVYLLAMRETGLDPSRTIVIEDTPTGTRAGVAAGATVLGFCERNDPRGLLDAGAVAVFAAMSELPRLLGVH